MSIDFKFSVGDYAGGHQPCQRFGSNEQSRRHVGATYTGPVTFFYFNRTTAHTRESIFGHNCSKDAVWCKDDPFLDENCIVVKFGGVLPKTPLKSVAMSNYQPK